MIGTPLESFQRPYIGSCLAKLFASVAQAVVLGSAVSRTEVAGSKVEDHRP